MVAKVGERLLVSKQAAQMFDVKRFNFKKLRELEVRREYHNKMPHRFAALENLNNNGDVYTAWEDIKESIKISARGSRICMNGSSIIGEEVSQFLAQRNQAKMQWLQD